MYFRCSWNWIPTSQIVTQKHLGGLPQKAWILIALSRKRIILCLWAGQTFQRLVLNLTSRIFLAWHFREQTAIFFRNPLNCRAARWKWYHNISWIHCQIIKATFPNWWIPSFYLTVMTVSQNPVLLRRVEEQAEDIEVNGMFLKACPFIWADENSALYLWVAKHHYLKYTGVRH